MSDKPASVDRSLETLAQMKLPLVLSDYESYHKTASRELENVRQLRKWEVTTLSAVAVYFLTQTESRASGGWLYLLIALFGVLELISHLSYQLLITGGAEAEKLFQEDDINEFRKNIVYWRYGNIASRERTVRDFAMGFVRGWASMVETLLWHGGVSVALWLLLKSASHSATMLPVPSVPNWL